MTQLQALALSIGIEAVVAFVLVRGLRWGGGTRAALAATIGTLITHPFVWSLVPRWEIELGYASALALIESGVVFAESVAYRVVVPLSWPRALFASLVANASSTAAGLLFYAFAG